MTNANCLKDIKCPDCGNEESFRIAARTIALVTDHGVEDHGDMEWDDGSYAECTACHRYGAMKDFKVTPSASPTDSDPAVKAAFDARAASGDDPVQQLLDALLLAQAALNTAPRFRVGDTDSYKIAAQVDAAIKAANIRRRP